MHTASFGARRPSAAAVLLAFALCGCVETGDFGRVKTSAWNDLVVQTGSLAAAARREPVSGLPLTDNERELRGRAWRFLVPAHDGEYLERVLADLVATRVLPASMRIEAAEAYFAALLSEDAASPASRYRRLSEDAAADMRLLLPFASVAARVLAADKVRVATLDYAATVTLDDAANAFARVSENRCLIAWVKAGLAGRRESYAYALQHLVIAAPQADAVPVERALSRLDEAASILGQLDVPPLAAAACLGAAGRPPSPPRPLAIPLVRKG